MSYLADLLVKGMANLTHLQRVLERKNRHIRRQRERLLEQQQRIIGLLDAFDLVRNCDHIAEAQDVAEAVLRYDERKDTARAVVREL